MDIRSSQNRKKMNARFFIVLAALNMFMSIAAGAFGAHGLKKILSTDMLTIWQTAVTYQMIHALGIFLIAVLSYQIKTRVLSAAAYIMFIGIILFSGSLYILALTGVNALGIVTPFGGTLFLIGWGLVAYAATKNTAA